MDEQSKVQDLSRRERQIMDVLYRLGKASAAEIHKELVDPPTYTAVRTHLTLLQGRGLVRYESDGTRYIYEPVVPRAEMGKTAIAGVMQTFFENSVEQVVSTLIDRQESRISSEELDRLAEIIERARKEGR
jgi:predicted transcriptional regulator